MPYKSEKIKLGEYDRRVKLTPDQKEEILAIYKSGVCGTRPLAKQFGVSRATIQIIVNPNIASRRKQYSKDNWRKYQLSREDHNDAVKNLRHYKQQLYLGGKIK